MTVRLTPKSAIDQIDGVAQLSDGGPVLKIRVRAVPQDGEATNGALIRVLAKALHIAASAVQLESGASGRLKTLHLQGDPEILAANLTRLSSRGGHL
jgi:uncharacterized protein